MPFSQRPLIARVALPTVLVLLPALAWADAAPNSAKFHAHWSQGKAEITSYNLEQVRYGETRPGHAVLVFVTEDFSRSKHVKLDYAARAGEDRVPVLKLNATKKFNTGVYPYSVMTSTFTAVDGSGTLKMTHTMQEWCGHVFAQLNREAGGWRGQERSYFESEGDRDFDLPDVLLEDEIWNRLRLNPAALPTGEVQVLPSAEYLRYSHRPWEPQTARAERLPANDGIASYRLTYPTGRILTIHYTASYPHAIEGWEDAERGRTSRATRNQSMMLDYWSRNSLKDEGLRQKLGLP